MQVAKKFFQSQLRLNMISGPVSAGLGVLVSAAKYPLYLHFLGYSQYGAWLLLSVVLTFAQMGLLGIGPAITKLVAEEFSRGRYVQIKQYFITAICMVATIGLLFVIASICFKTNFIGLLGLKGENALIAEGLLVYMVFLSIEVMAYQVINSVIAGMGRMDIANYSQTVLQVLPLLLSVPLLLTVKGIASLLLSHALAYLVVFSFNYFYLKSLLNMRLIDIGNISWKRLKILLSFGGTVFVGSMLHMSVLPITNMVITRTIGVESLPVFEVAYRTGMQVRSLFEAALRALMPEISGLSSSLENSADKDRVKKLITKAYKYLFLTVPPVYVCLYLFAGIIFKIWLGEKYDPSIPIIFRIMLFVSLVSLMGVIPYYKALGIGAVNDILIYHGLNAVGTVVCLFMVVAFSPALSNIMGCFIVGSILGTIYLLRKEYCNSYSKPYSWFGSR